MDDIPKICIIIPYFGKWPYWIDYFFLSCKFNPEIDWLILTDCKFKETNARNIKFIKTNLNKLNHIASRKLGIKLNIKYPYKLCDLKPAYGLIFSNYIKNYDFWGYSDLDLIYGNIKSFLTKDILTNYDIISNHPNFITGHFCILRNKLLINELFKEGNYYKIAFKKKKYIGFDEKISYIGINTNPQFLNFFKRINILFHIILVFLYRYLKSIIPSKIQITNPANTNKLKDFTSIARYFQKRNKIRIYNKKNFQSDLMLKKYGCNNWYIKWNNGYLNNNQENKELLYFHFLLSKFNKSFHIETLKNDSYQFIITRTGIFNQ